jgi:hypothetical protein
MPLAALGDMTQIEFMTKNICDSVPQFSCPLFALATLGDATLIEITYFYVASHNVAKGKVGYMRHGITDVFTKKLWQCK